MAMNKKELIELVQKLPDKDIPLVADLISRLLTHPDDYYIPYDDEPLTEDDIKAIDEARIEFQTGKTIKFEDIKHDF
jgi:hypothetical protein